MLPSFNEFLAELNSKEFSEQLIQNASVMEGSFNLLTQEGLTEYSAAIVRYAFQNTLDVLRAYHEWLTKQS